MVVTKSFTNTGKAKKRQRTRPRIFVDTGAWVAAAVEDDAHHKEAIRVYPELIQKYHLVTTNLVVAETYILLLRTAGQGTAIEFLERIAASPRIHKVYSTPELEEEAEKILKRYQDQDFSYTDAVSFVVMRQESLKEAFAFDTHFRTMGFLLIP